MTSKIFIVEDDNTLIQDAQNVLDMQYKDYLSSNKLGGITHEIKLKYDFIPLELPKALDVTYWQDLGITTQDCVVLDLHYGNYMDPNTKTFQRIPFNGRDVLLMLAMNKENGRGLADLERVLIATSLPLEVNPEHVHPDIALISGFDVYGLEKGKNKKDEVVGYGKSLLDRLDAIYEPFLLSEDERVTPLNIGWRGDRDVKAFRRVRG